jgi:hypothetical protein
MVVVCGPCAARPPKLLAIDDFETSRGNCRNLGLFDYVRTRSKGHLASPNGPLPPRALRASQPACYHLQPIIVSDHHLGDLNGKFD